MLDEPTFASRRTPVFDFAAEPFAVIGQSGQQVQRELIHVAVTFRSEMTELGFELRREVQIPGAW
jgi:hypothetical protein